MDVVGATLILLTFLSPMRRTACCIALLLFIVGGSAVAQPTVSVRGNVGAAFFRSPNGLSSVLNSGVDLGLGASVELFSGVELTLEGGYDAFTLNGDNVALRAENLDVGSSSDVNGGQYSLLNASMGLRYVIENQTDAHPYLSAGVGIYRSMIAETEIYQEGRLVQMAGERTTTGTGLQLAVGVEFEINETYAFFFEPRYVIVDTDEEAFGLGTSTRFIPLRMGLDVAL